MTQRRLYTRQIIEHADFQGGDWGRRQPWNAKQNQFKALNMLVYSTGEIGVRAGLADITPTNIGAGQIAWGMTNVPGLSQYYYAQGNQLFRASSTKGQIATAMTGTFSSNPGTLYFANQGSALYINAPAIGIYSLIGGTLTQLVAALAGNGLAFFGDRLVIGEYTGTTAQLRYNGTTAGVSDLTSWPAANLIPVGDKNERITNLLIQRGHLDIIKKTNGLYTLTGQLSVNETLRRAAGTLGPADVSPYGSVVTENDTVWYTAGPFHNIPAMFDGTNVRYFEDQLIPLQNNAAFNMASFVVSDPMGVAITSGTDPSSTAYNTTRLMLFHHGVWTQHTLPDIGPNSEMTSTQNLTVFDPGNFISASALPADTATQIRQAPALVIANGTSTTPKMYSLLLDLDRPGYLWPTGTPFATLNSESPGDASAAQVSGTLELPEVHLQQGTEMMVAGVTIDFRSWNTGGSLTNHFDMQIDCLRTYDSTERISLKNSWDQVGSLSSTGGTVRRVTFMFGDQGVGNGYQLKLSNIRGVAFQRFQVILDTDKYNVRGM